MQIEFKKVGDMYRVKLTDYATGFSRTGTITEAEARTLAGDLEHCSQAIFAVLPELNDGGGMLTAS
jgi:hypothetical protein